MVRSGPGTSEERQQRVLQGNSVPKRDLHVRRCIRRTPKEKTVADDLREVCLCVHMCVTRVMNVHRNDELSCLQIEENIGELDLQNVYDLLTCNVEAMPCKMGTTGMARHAEKSVL